MKSKIFKMMIMLCILIIYGCGQNNETKLEVSRAFAVTSQFDGGLIVQGESVSGKKVTISIDNGFEKSISLDPDVWTFYAIGWTGPSKLTGTTQCGLSTVDTNSNKVVEIATSTAGCTAAFNTKVGWKYTRFLACSSFNKYNLSDDSWTPISAATADSACTNAPLGFRPSYNYYKIVAIDFIKGLPKPVFESACTQFDGSVETFLPTDKIPFIVRGYKSLSDCNDTTSLRFQSFLFKDGLDAGNLADFDHLTTESGSSPIHKRIILPTTLTKRGRTPFMNMIPDIRCGSSATSLDECIPATTANVHVNVNWSNSRDQQVLKRDAASIAPCAQVNASQYFGATKCNVEDGLLKAEIHRNKFTCIGATPDISNVTDMDYVDEKFFLLRPNTNDNVEIYNEQGKLLSTMNLGLTGFTKVGVTKENNIYYVYAYKSPNIYKYSISALTLNNVTSFGGVSVASDLMDFSVIANDFITYGTNAGKLGIGYIGGAITEISPNGANPISLIVHKNNTIYYFQNGYLRIHYFSAGSFTSAGTSIPSSNVYSLAIDLKQDILYFKNSTGFVTSLSGTDLSTISPTMTSSAGGAASMVAINKKLFLAGSTRFFTYIDSGAGSLIDKTNITNICNETITVAGQSLNFKTSTDNYYDLWRNAVDVIGRKTLTAAQIDFASFLFPDLSKDDDISGGGRLRKAQEFLGQDISSVLSQYPTCATLDADIGTGSKYFPVHIVDRFKTPVDEFDFVLKVSDTNVAVPLFQCVANDPNAAACAGPLNYDLKLEFELKDPVTTAIQEKGIFYVKCNSKIGSYETFEKKGNLDFERKRIVYQADDYRYGRFEEYKLESKSIQEYSASITKLQKNGNDDFSSRMIDIGYQSNNVYANATELQRQATNLLTYYTHVSDSDWTTFKNNSSTLTTRSATDFTASAPTCIPVSTTDIYTSNQQGGCILNSLFTQMQLPPYSGSSVHLRIDDVSDIDSPTPDIANYFQLTIP